KMNYQINLNESIKILSIPLSLDTIALILGIPHVIGIPLILALSYISYTRFRIISKEDLGEISAALFSKETLVNLSPYLKPILRILYGE
ncbi:MAG: hypothetical protein ABDH32_08050, partial [Candidatus Caldarchaeales archaeon]